MGCEYNPGRLIFIHLQSWEVLPFLIIQRQRCIKILCPEDPEFYTPLVLNCQKGQHLPALEVYKNQSPKSVQSQERTIIKNLVSCFAGLGILALCAHHLSGVTMLVVWARI